MARISAHNRVRQNNDRQASSYNDALKQHIRALWVLFWRGMVARAPRHNNILTAHPRDITTSLRLIKRLLAPISRIGYRAALRDM